MSTIDIFLLIPLLFGAYKGYNKGILKEIVSIVAFILAIIGGFKLLHWAIGVLEPHLEGLGKILPFVAFFILFMAIVFLVNFIGRMVKKTIDLTFLGWFDGLLGAFLGILKWAFGISVLLWLLSYVDIVLPENYRDGSFLIPLIEPIAPTVVEYLAVLLPFIKDLFNSSKEAIQSA